LRFLSSLSAGLGKVLVRYGGWGLFAISFLDASAIGLPLINDLLLMHLSSQRPRFTFVYVLQSTAGSVLGSYALYAFVRAGRRLWRRSWSRPAACPETAGAERPEYGRERAEETRGVRRWLERNDFAAIVIGSLLPPPAPFKAFPVAAAAARMELMRFITALVVGRGLRFGLEGWMGALYGASAEKYLRTHLAQLSFLSIALIVGAIMLYRFYNRKLKVEAR
jgi:membrane protein YqaA with SNARE-associated domain